MLSAGNSAAGPSRGRLLKLLSLLFLAGVAMRMTILAMPPVIPLVHRELHMSETQVGLLIGLPLALFAIAAIPGSMLIARIGTNRAVIIGMAIAAVASGARGAAIDVTTLYAGSIATGFGVAIMQPGMPTLAREWLPGRVALGTIAYTSGMLIGSTISSSLTIPYVLPWLGGSWRRDLVFWAIPGLLIVPVFALFGPRRDQKSAADPAIGGRWWPDFRNPPGFGFLVLPWAATTARSSQPMRSSAIIWSASARPICLGRRWHAATVYRWRRPSSSC